MRKILTGVVAFFLNLVYSLLGQSPPNVVVIVADDLGYADARFTHDVFMPESEHLPEVNTPHIDSLAREGIIFSNGYASGYVCSPTRAGLMLGRYQQRVGVYTAGQGGRGMPVLEDDGSGGFNYINPIFPAFLKNDTDGVPDFYCGAFGK